jgi:hypothetical protein
MNQTKGIPTISAISERAFWIAARRAGLKIIRRDKGSLLLTFDNCHFMLAAPTLRNKTWHYQWHGDVAGEFFACGKRFPPLKRMPRRGVPRMFSILRKQRFARIYNTIGVKKLIDIVLEYGTGGKNDIYIFEQTGRWLLYINHHDEVVVHIPVLMNGARTSVRELRKDKKLKGARLG